MTASRAGWCLLALLPAALGLGLARLERQEPGWLRPGTPAAPPPAGVTTSLPRRVLAVHYAWYGTPEGPTGRWRHWLHPRVEGAGGRVLTFRVPPRPGRPPELGTAHHPLGGPYDSQDPRVVARQLHELRLAGLDGLAVSWWGAEAPDAAVFARLLVGAAERGLVVAPYYEVAGLAGRGAAGIARDLEVLLERHRDASAWLRVEGRPVVFLYGTQALRPDAWRYVRARLLGAGRGVWLVGDSHRPRWAAWLDALHVYSPARFWARGQAPQGANREWAAAAHEIGGFFVPAVSPGYDDRRIRLPGTAVDRAGGTTYEEAWRAALAVDAPWVLVTSWNEWHEGTEIEPSLEHGQAYLDATRRWAERFRARGPWTPPGPHQGQTAAGPPRTAGGRASGTP